MKSQKTVISLAGLGPFVLLAACSQPTTLERSFGDSVRNMIEAQTYDPGTLSAPSTETIDGVDGQRLERVLEVYRTDIAQPATVDGAAVSAEGER